MWHRVPSKENQEINNTNTRNNYSQRNIYIENTRKYNIIIWYQVMVLCFKKTRTGEGMVGYNSTRSIVMKGTYSGHLMLTEIREFFPFTISPILSFRLLDSEKDMLMDSNEVYTLIKIRWNNPKRSQGSQIVLNMHTVILIFEEGSVFMLIRKSIVSGFIYYYVFTT